MPYIKKSPIQEKLWELAQQVPGAKYALPDPYDPTSYVMPIGGVAKQAFTKELIKPLFRESKLPSQLVTQIKDALKVAGKLPKKVITDLEKLSAFESPKIGWKAKNPPFKTASGITGFYTHPDRFSTPPPKIIPGFGPEIRVETVNWGRPPEHSLPAVLAHEGGHAASERILTMLAKKPAATTSLYETIRVGEWEGVAEYLGYELQKSAGVASPSFHFPYGEFQERGFRELSKMPSKNAYMNVYRYFQKLMK